MKKFILFLLAIVIAGAIAAIAVIKPDKKPTPGESSGTQTESPSGSGGTETPTGGLKITLNPTQFIIDGMERINSGESGGGSESGDQSDGKVTGIEIKPGEILFGEE